MLPGTYFVNMSLVVNGIPEELVSKQSFTVKRLNNSTLPASDMHELAAYLKKLNLVE